MTPLLPTPAEWQTINISEGGVFVQAPELLPPGSMLDLGLWLAADRITGKAEVVWTNDPSRPGSDPGLPIGMGLKFLGLGKRDRELFRRFLQDLERRAAPEDPGSPPPVVESEPRWVASADVEVDVGPVQGPGELDGFPDVLPAGTILGSYRVIRRLGCGGMGDVYVAEHVELGRRVAVKRLHARYAADRQVAARFLGEARVVNEICHPNIVEITDFCGTGEQPYFVMELLTGQTLEDALSSAGALPLARVLRIGSQLSAVLAAVHDKRVVHRDLKPQNIFLIERDGDRDFVKLLDFGIAKNRGAGASSSVDCTAAGVVLGTPGYMAPEQLDGQPVDFRSDIYAFGIVLYQMTTGRAPFLADTWGKLVLQQVTQKPPRPSDIAGHTLPEPLEELILACLAAKPGKRPESMAAIHAVLEELGARMIDESPTEPEIDLEPASEIVMPPSPARPRHPMRAAAVMGLVAAMAAGVAWVSLRGSPARGGHPVASAPGEVVARVPPAGVADPADPLSPPPVVVGAAFAVRAQSDVTAPIAEPATVGGRDGERPRSHLNNRRARASATRAGAEIDALFAGLPSAQAIEPTSTNDLREHYQRGLSYLRERKPFLAVEELEQVIALDPTYAPAYRALGSVYGLIGREPKVVEYWSRYLALAPNGPDAAKIRELLERARASGH